MEDVTLRRAEDADAGPAAEVWLRSYDAALPTVRRAHTDDEVRAWFREVVAPQRETCARPESRPGPGAERARAVRSAP